MHLLKYFVLVAACLPLLCRAQVAVLGFEVGASTLPQVEARLARQTGMRDRGINRFTGGAQFGTDGSGYGIAGLTGVRYIFDKDKKLAAILMDMEKNPDGSLGGNRFDEIFRFLAEKYKVTAKRRPFVGDMFARFKAQGVTIELDAPHLDFSMQARYVRDDLFQQFTRAMEQDAQRARAREKNQF